MSLLCSISGLHAQWDTVGIRHFSTGAIYGPAFGHNDYNVLYTGYGDQSMGGKGVVRKFDGTSWLPVGPEGFTQDDAMDCALAFEGTDSVFFAFSDSAYDLRNSLRMYNGFVWLYLGSGISDTQASYNNILKGNGDTSYLIYQEAVPNSLLPTGLIKAKLFDGSNWFNVGSGTLSNNYYRAPCARFDNNGVLHVAFTNTSSVELMKFDGANWVTAAPSYSTLPNSIHVSLAFDSNNIPYIADDNALAISVRKYVNNAWTDVGNIGNWPDGFITGGSLAIDQNDTPYLAYGNVANYAECKKFNGTTWASVGGGPFSVSTVYSPSMTINDYGNLYVAFADDASINKATVMKFENCTPPVISSVSTPLPICQGDTANLSVTGNLGSGTVWNWYTGSCGGTYVGSGANIAVSPADSTVYYVGAAGGCITNVICSAVLVDVQDSVTTPVISTNGALLTSSITNGNQWYTNGAPIPGQTNQTYTATVSGWYYTSVTNGICSNTSDSVYVIGTGVNNMSILQQAQIFPVPFSNELNININASNTADWKLSITDNIGRIVYTQNELRRTNSIDLRVLPSGMYFLTLSNDQGKQVFKLSK